MTEFDASAGRMPSVIERDGLSVLLVFAALVVTLLLQPAAVITLLFSLPSFRAPGSVAWAPGCLLSCSPLALDYFLLEPIKGFAIGLSDLPYHLAFTLSALLVSWLTAARRRAADALQRAYGEMEANVQERTAGLRQGNEALQIGVAEAAFFPTLTLSASSGFESSSLSQWLTAPSRFWSVGPSISETVFDGGLRRAQTDFARAGYEASVGRYRQTVLTAFQAVEDTLAALRIFEQEAQVQDETVTDAQKSVTLTMNGKDGGKTWHPIPNVCAGIYQRSIAIPFLAA